MREESYMVITLCYVVNNISTLYSPVVNTKCLTYKFRSKCSLM